MSIIVDRLKDIVIASGYKIYPRKVEEEIYRHPGGRGSGCRRRARCLSRRDA